MINPPITKFIPQRPPMVMIDEVVDIDSGSATSSFRVQPENIFQEDARFSAPGLIENIAQTAAAMVGHHCAAQNLPVPIGFIASVKDLKVYFLPGVLSAIFTKVKVTNTVMNVTIIEGRVTQGEKLVCSCEMKIFVQTNTK